MDGRAVQDIVAMTTPLRSALGDSAAPIALRGSSMGGYLAILAAEPAGARAVVAICPASGAGLARSLRAGRLGFAADVDGFGAFLDARDLGGAVATLAAPVLVMHAEGDEVVPIAHSRELERSLAATGPAGSRLIAVPGGHHRSIQHDEQLQAVSLRFIAQALGPIHRQPSSEA
jgi:pimeloyl-ACP methyl ester carboxylesterase